MDTRHDQGNRTNADSGEAVSIDNPAVYMPYTMMKGYVEAQVTKNRALLFLEELAGWIPGARIEDPASAAREFLLEYTNRRQIDFGQLKLL